MTLTHLETIRQQHYDMGGRTRDTSQAVERRPGQVGLEERHDLAENSAVQVNLKAAWWSIRPTTGLYDCPMMMMTMTLTYFLPPSEAASSYCYQWHWRQLLPLPTPSHSQSPSAVLPCARLSGGPCFADRFVPRVRQAPRSSQLALEWSWRWAAVSAPACQCYSDRSLSCKEVI